MRRTLFAKTVLPARHSADDSTFLSTVVPDPINGQALLTAVLRTPWDNAPRLAYAAWLAVSGRNDQAEFINLQFNPEPPSSEHWPQRDGDQRSTDGFLMSSAIADWTGEDALRDAGLKVPIIHRRPGGRHVGGTLSLGWDRGFVEEIRASAADFALVAETLFRRHPITRVVLDDAEDFLWTERKDGGARILWLTLPGRNLWLGDPATAGVDRLERDPRSGMFGQWLADQVSRACVARGRKLAGLPS
ncbi:TIGR02996 domain-containing protein [Zavarzinella formosa]|uniref:TIGR02996 domain-containing protein n=1 Tax=Zavarzinella formosa TaxID=360055 RepID=UPI0002D6A61D|nr:TIGR02996 domain-containing protein [Zavarzinella formosa]